MAANYNIGVDTCDKCKWANGSGRLALICADGGGRAIEYSFDQLKWLSDHSASTLLRHGARLGNGVAIFLPQSVETAIAHVAVYKAGMIAVPLFAFLVRHRRYRAACAIEAASRSLLTFPTPSRYEIFADRSQH
ncbi:AMP-binding protein [Paraburkholderia sp.]|uniref:AMP-binding protein n=1 Tax=Paraburkholderia sp. TaxID=1926495 RepID=UPI003C7D3DA7